MKFWITASIFALCSLIGGCDSSPDHLPMVWMKIGSRSFHVEIANTDATMQKGLMKRDSMPEDHGMIFVFPSETEREFWMKNTRFPLDILFLSTSGKIVSIKQMVPYDEDRTPSDGPAQYAIELNKGAANAAGVKAGDVIEIPSEARSNSAVP